MKEHDCNSLQVLIAIDSLRRKSIPLKYINLKVGIKCEWRKGFGIHERHLIIGSED